MTRALLLTISALIGLAPSAAADPPTWAKRRVPVHDYTSPEWQAVVADVVNEFNAAMPPRVPRLVHVPMGESRCERLPAYGTNGRIGICLSDGFVHEDDPGGYSATVYDKRRIYRVMVWLRPDFPESWRRNAMCHELMHALTGIDDVPLAERTKDSCVHGTRGTLGPLDIAFARRAYGDDRPKDKRHGKHRRHR